MYFSRFLFVVMRECKWTLTLCITKIKCKMKKYLLLMLLCVTMGLLSSCSNDEMEEDKLKETTYTFMYSAANQPTGFTLDITLFEYNEKNERVEQTTIENVKNGTVRTIIAGKYTQKVKVYLVTHYGDKQISNWVQKVYYIEMGKNTEVNVTGDIRIGSNEP